MRVIGFQCSGCDGLFDWTTEDPVSDRAEIKTIGSRYCVGCIDKEAEAHGVSRERILEFRVRLGRRVP